MSISALIGSSPKFQSVLENVQIVAPVSCAVLLRGETGTGKEIIAHAIHDASPRRQQQFVAVKIHASRIFVRTALLVLCALPMHGQTANSGAIAGTVSDPSGALVPRAAVDINSQGTGEKRDLATDAE